MKHAIVTGGARRIGRAIVLALHKSGYSIGLHYNQSSKQADQLQASLNKIRPDSCKVFQANLRDEHSIAKMGSAILTQYGQVDLLVNNASGFSPTPIEECQPEQFDQMLGSNLRGPYFLIQALLPGLREAGGNIVNIVDTHIDRPLPDFNAYGAAKAGLASLTRSLAVELGPAIRVNGIAPGAILWPEDDIAYDEDTRRRTIKRTPLKRLGDPNDIARTVIFLADHAPFITGQVICVDGGRSLV